ncbi:hypothetical protein K4F52_009588 [Lecanicillium sp. MT-2017a]|nr:hypothetical protein K4F52_009588 [Lecanicillium sp. MT-2017a]
MKISAIAFFTASLAGSAAAMDLTYYGGVKCRGNEYFRETIYIGTRCRKFDGRKTNAASILTNRRNDPREAGCFDRSQGGKRIQSVKVIESPFNRQAEVVEVAGEGDEAE